RRGGLREELLSVRTLLGPKRIPARGADEEIDEIGESGQHKREREWSCQPQVTLAEERERRRCSGKRQVRGDACRRQRGTKQGQRRRKETLQRRGCEPSDDKDNAAKLREPEERL